MTLWTPADSSVQPLLMMRDADAVWSGSNLTSIVNAGSEGGSFTVYGPPDKGTLLNGAQPIRFNAGTEGFGKVLDFPNTGKMSIFFYSKMITAGDNGIVNKAWIDAGQSNLSVLYASTAGVTQFIGNLDFGGTTAAAQTTGQIRSVYAQLGATNDCWSDGVQLAMASSTTAAVPNHASYEWGFGSGNSQGLGGGETSNSEFLCIALFSDWLTTAERNKWEGYWHWRGGTQSQLPVGHPYKLAAPTISASATAAITLGLLSSSAAVANKVAASVSRTLGALTSSATTAVRNNVAASIALGALTTTAAATARDAATASVTLGALTTSATAIAKDAASASITLGALSSSATGAVRNSAAAAITLGALTSAAVVTNPDAATASNTLAPLTVSATATVRDQVSASITLGALTATATASNTPGLTAAIALGSLTATATATVRAAANATVTLGSLSTSAIAAAKISASAGIALGSLAGSASAVARGAAASNVTLGELTASSIVINPVAGQANVTLDPLTVLATAYQPSMIRRIDPAALLV